MNFTKYLRTLILGLVGMIALAGCSSLFYYPTRFEHVDRTKLPIQPRDVEFTSQDGTHLHGWYFTSKAEKRRDCTIVFFHGNAQNLTSHFATLISAPFRGYDYFIFDYRGYGSSDDVSPSPQKTVEDGHAALRWAKAQNPNRPLVVFGQSLGGAVALRTVIDLRADIQPSLVVVDSTFSTYQGVARRALANHWFTWLLQPLAYLTLSDQYAPESRLSELAPTPLIVIHGEDDKTVDESLGRRLFEKAPEPKEFWEVKGGRHTDFMWRDDGVYAKRFFDALDARCPVRL